MGVVAGFQRDFVDNPVDLVGQSTDGAFTFLISVNPAGWRLLLEGGVVVVVQLVGVALLVCVVDLECVHDVPVWCGLCQKWRSAVYCGWMLDLLELLDAGALYFVGVC